MYLIDKTFFYGSIDIANLDELCNGNPAFVLDISQYEKEALINTLGAIVTKDLLNQFEFVQGKYKLKSTADSKWSNLINGETYTDGCGNSKVWNGIVQMIDTVYNSEQKQIKKSYLANYIYYKVSLNSISHTSGVGETVLVAENAESVSNEIKRKNAFNEFVNIIQGNNRNNVCLYQYMQDKRDLFSSWNCVYYKYLNVFDV